MKSSKVSKEDFERIAGRYFPSEALDYAWFYFEENHFSFKIVPPRKTKKGDFKYSKNPLKMPVITVNNNLCSYDFLLVYIHELAHYMVFRHHDIFKVKSHGPEWRQFFKELLQNLVNEVPLPEDISTAFLNYSNRIKSSTAADYELETALDRYREKPDHIVYLKSLQVGDRFSLRGQLFRVDSFARTRAKCTLEGTRKKYLISAMMNVEKINH